MKIRVLGNRLLVECHETEFNEAGLWIPERERPERRDCTVLQVGERVWYAVKPTFGKAKLKRHHSTDIKVGDTVLIDAPGLTVPFKLNGKKVMIVSALQVLAIWRKEHEE